MDDVAAGQGTAGVYLLATHLLLSHSPMYCRHVDMEAAAAIDYRGPYQLLPTKLTCIMAVDLTQ